ncbi:hypothetical protein ICW40_03205 [Actinotalea ferrariae]|uniref:hypothetical protein n=1 Tax=Actinotalea ferrariae TaxID=1386098 RepID=UPI001C8BA390|nr:hypothetical protein [Actinotalea ferrariae]MBX9243813.1 hypothetical protein [Actinotalea ferrariae]
MWLNNSSKVIAGALVVLTATLVAGCTPADEVPPTPTTSTPTTTPSASERPTPSVDPEVSTAEAAILEAYRGYWATKVAILADPAVEPGTALEAYAVDTALTDVYSTVLTYRSNRIVMVGEPITDPTVSEVVPGVEGTATITDCVDVGDWQPMFRDTGESAAAPGQASEVLTVSTAYFYMDRWTIRTSVVDRDTPC